MREVEVRDDGIRLGQFLKLAGLADTGATARVLLDLGEVEVNGEQETRRGRQLRPGDVVTCGESDVRVVERPVTVEPAAPLEPPATPPPGC